MNEVWIYHPGLDRYSQVPESAVGAWARSGWIQRDPPPSEEPGEESLDEAAAEAEPSSRSTRKSSTTRPASDEE